MAPWARFLGNFNLWDFSKNAIFLLIFSSNERKNVWNQFLCIFCVFEAYFELKEWFQKFKAHMPQWATFLENVHLWDCSKKAIFSLIFISNDQKNVVNQFFWTFWAFEASLELKEWLQKFEAHMAPWATFLENFHLWDFSKKSIFFEKSHKWKFATNAIHGAIWSSNFWNHSFIPKEASNAKKVKKNWF